ncbi:hypothetical protein HWE17_18640 [Janthinobacterium sp. BJB401]|nr:hypothetical protein [Janthinobacterium sp. BJB401]
MKLVDRKDTRISGRRKQRFGEWRKDSGEWRNGGNDGKKQAKKRPAKPALKGFAVHTATWSCSAQPRGAGRKREQKSGADPRGDRLTCWKIEHAANFTAVRLNQAETSYSRSPDSTVR